MTSDLEKQNIESPKKSDLTNVVLNRIKTECMTPSPRWQFLCIEYSMWVLWGLTVVFGSVAFSVIIFFLMHSGIAVYEATHESLVSLFLDTAPLLWVSAFAVMAVLAHYNLRHTKCGYRYTVLRVLVSSIFFSLVGGLLLHAIGVGFMVDDFLSKKLPQFPALSHVERHIWQQPSDGRMIGEYIGPTTIENLVLFKDTDGVVWELSIAEINPIDQEFLYLGKTVHLIGLASTTIDNYFHGCAVMRAKPQKPSSFRELKDERTEFLKRMREHQAEQIEDFIATGTIPEFITKPLCAGNTAVLRVQNLR